MGQATGRRLKTAAAAHAAYQRGGSSARGTRATSAIAPSGDSSLTVRSRTPRSPSRGHVAVVSPSPRFGRPSATGPNRAAAARKFAFDGGQVRVRGQCELRGPGRDRIPEKPRERARDGHEPLGRIRHRHQPESLDPRRALRAQEDLDLDPALLARHPPGEVGGTVRDDRRGLVRAQRAVDLAEPFDRRTAQGERLVEVHVHGKEARRPHGRPIGRPGARRRPALRGWRATVPHGQHAGGRSRPTRANGVPRPPAASSARTGCSRAPRCRSRTRDASPCSNRTRGSRRRARQSCRC